MLFDKIKIDPKLKSQILQAIGTTEDFYSKITRLKNKWKAIVERGIGDCQEVRLISPVIFEKLTPINACIIADNLEVFKEIYKPVSTIDKKLLKIICLCGAEKIAEFLLESVDDRFNRYNFMLTYVAASMNEEWAKKIANEMRERNIPIPKGIYVFSDMELINSIEAIFSSKQESEVKPINS